MPRRSAKNVRAECVEDASDAIKAEKQKNRDGLHNLILNVAMPALLSVALRVFALLSYPFFRRERHTATVSTMRSTRFY